MMLSYTGDDDYDVGQGDYSEESTHNAPTPPSASYGKAPKRIALDHQGFALTQKEKETLAKNTMDSSYLDKFREFLVYHNKISDQNVRNVMRQVTKLATGQGVRYESAQYGWHQPHQIFMKGVKITPLSDFIELMKRATKAENEWGRDHGNGWLLNHPLKKMLLFQQFCLQNPDFLGTKRCLKEYYAMDDEEEKEERQAGTVPEAPSEASRAAHTTTTAEDTDTEPPTPSSPAVKATGKRGRPKKHVAVVSPSPKKRNNKSNQEHIGSRIAKYFEEGTLYFGTVTKYRPKFWWIKYDDGDEEEMDAHDLTEALTLYAQEGKDYFEPLETLRVEPRRALKYEVLSDPSYSGDTFEEAVLFRTTSG
jgi:hypothetical protein